jgi:hypothetical protein
VRCPNIGDFIKKCKEKNILPPLRVSKYYPNMKDVALVCVTEMNKRSSIEEFIQIAQSTSEKQMEGK